jgi:outer membrane protein assembly factor BamB
MGPLALLLGVGAVLALLSRAPRVLSFASMPRVRGASSAATAPWQAVQAPSAALVPEVHVMTHGDARRTHRAHGVGPTTANVLWKTAVGGAVATQPQVTRDLQHAYVATLAGELVKLALDGSIVWRRTVGGRAYGAPAIAANGNVILGSDDHALFAFSPDGALLYRLKLDDEADVAVLVRKDDSVVVAAGKELVGVAPNGTVLFRFAAKGKIFTAAAEGAAGELYFGAQDHHGYALSARGGLVWRVNLGADVDGSPAVADDGSIVFGTDRGELVRVGARGDVLARTSLGGYLRGGLALARSGDALVGVYGPLPGLARVSPAGEVLGVFRIQGTGAKEFGVHGGALEDDTGALFFGAQDNKMYALEPDGKLRFTLETSGDIDAPVTLLPNGRLLVASEDGTVYCVGN